MKKNKGTNKCNKSTVRNDVDITSCEKKTIKCEQKREPSNVTKVQSHVMLVLPNMMMKLLNVKKKHNGSTECDRSMVICYVGTT